MRAFIYTGGVVFPENITEHPKGDDLCIAADSGFHNAKKCGDRVDILVGDLDSIGSYHLDKKTELYRVEKPLCIGMCGPFDHNSFAVMDVADDLMLLSNRLFCAHNQIPYHFSSRSDRFSTEAIFYKRYFQPFVVGILAKKRGIVNGFFHFSRTTKIFL